MMRNVIGIKEIGMFIAIKDLPLTVQDALSTLGYHKHDIEVKAQERYNVNPNTAFEGNRGFTAAVNLDSGKLVSIHGSWGGGNPFETHTIDHSLESPLILPNAAIIQGESGGRGTFARIYVAPQTLAQLLPAPQTELTEIQGVVLYCLKGYKSNYRRPEAERYGVDVKAYDNFESGDLKMFHNVTLTEADKHFIRLALEMYVREQGANALIAGVLDKDRNEAESYDQCAQGARKALDKVKLAFGY